MPAYTDARFEALRLNGYTGSTNDMLLDWLGTYVTTNSPGAPTPTSLPDAWGAMLSVALGAGSTGNRIDDWGTLLVQMGHSGSLNDMELAFWLGGGTLPPPPV